MGRIRVRNCKDGNAHADYRANRLFETDAMKMAGKKETEEIDRSRNDSLFSSKISEMFNVIEESNVPDIYNEFGRGLPMRLSGDGTYR